MGIVQSAIYVDIVIKYASLIFVKYIFGDEW